MIDRLLAKSWDSAEGDPPESVYLPIHLQEVYTAAVQVLESTAGAQLAALGLSPNRWQQRLCRVVSLAAALHDLGKANEHFQMMIRKARSERQGLRHEWVTLLLVQSDGWREWLSPALAEPENDWEIVLWCITGHHVKYDRPSPPRLASDGAGTEIPLLVCHVDFTTCVDWLCETFHLGGRTPKPPDKSIQLIGSGSAFETLLRWHMKACQKWSNFREDEKRFTAAAKNCLVAADVAGSALPQTGTNAVTRSEWVPGSFARVPSPDDLCGIVADRLNCPVASIPDALRPFQREVSEKAGRVTLVRAGCGTGKTLAAYHWAATTERCRNRRLYICYPTTGTATEGYRDYLLDVSESTETGTNKPKAGAALFHGRRDVDLRLMGAADDEDREGAEPLALIDSLEAWSTPIATCTVDTVLGLVQNNRKGLYAWPALAQSAFVFDEIHAYDDRLFGALLRFLQAMCGVPVLMMTASLPEGRLRSIRQTLGKSGETLVEVPGPKALEELPRYHRICAAGTPDALPQIRAEMIAGGKVLWVCNTVARVMRAAEQAVDLSPLIYHSRFKYLDRVRRHNRVVHDFKPELNLRPALAICTQVAEMSLDLSATMLVTDLAPVPSMIQRLGRLNRRAMPPTKGQPLPPTRPLIVIEPFREDGSPDTLPYTPDDFAQTRQWLLRLGEKRLSQADLARKWHEQDADRLVPHVPSAWLDGGPTSQVLELREGSPGITVLMDADWKDLKAGTGRLLELTLPMPPPPTRLNWREWPRFCGIPVAPEGIIEYDPERGARWQA